MLSILVPDNLHINARNFASFHKFLEKNKIRTHFNTKRMDWIALYGNYENKHSDLKTYATMLRNLSQDRLFEIEVHGVNLFKVARAECLSKAIVTEHWCESIVPLNHRAIYDKLYEHDRVLLLNCMAAAYDWLEFWKAELNQHTQFTHSCIFSGSLIYSRSLMELLKYTPTRIMLLESFYTGNEYYCEEKLEPIANNCSIKNRAVYQSIRLPESRTEYEKERNKAINKILLMKNKNVSQPAASEELVFKHSGKTVAIIGQVVNDFSVLEYRGLGFSTVAFYKTLIRALVGKGFNVVFKAHPWEHKKTNIGSPFTKEKIEALRTDLGSELANRLIVVEDYNIKQLFDQVEVVVGINSQGLLEACFHGLKPVQFGNAFYGGFGFTHDYKPEQIECFVEDLAHGGINGSLQIREYAAFEEYITKLLQMHLVSVHDSGQAILAKKFHVYTNVTIDPLVRQTSDAIESQALSSQKNIDVTSESESTRSNKAKVSTYSPAAEAVKLADHQSVGPGLPPQKPISSAARKLKKFRRNPYQFCLDSKNGIVRSMRIFFQPLW